MKLLQKKGSTAYLNDRKNIPYNIELLYLLTNK